MNFLFPLYLLGLAALAVPILLHLRRKPPKDRTDFSSIMFLEASPLQRKRRRNLENILLLLMRCALICLLAFLFARPFVRGTTLAEGGGEGRWSVVLLDRSASMQREDLWERARKKAVAVAGDAGPEDRLALVLFDRNPLVVAGFDQWKLTPASERAGLWENELAAIDAKPGWAATDLGGALATATELLDEEQQSESGEDAASPEEVAIYLVSDLQEGGDLTALETLAWPEGAELVLETVEAKSEDNASLHLMASENVLALVEGDRDGAAEEEDASGPRVRVVNHRASGVESFAVAWDGAESDEATDLLLAAGMQRTIRMEPSPAAGDAGTIDLAGDAHPFDNRVYVAREARRPLRVLYFGSPETKPDDAQEPLYYLERAIQATTLHEPFVSNELPADLNLAETADFVVVAHEPETREREKIRSHAEAGGTVLLLLRAPEQGILLGEMLGTGPLLLEEREPETGYALLEEFDFENPLLAVFSDPRVRDFSKVHFWKYRRLMTGQEWPENGEVVARFDTGDPALLSFPVGEGRLVAFASSWHPGDSKLALSTKFVPLIYSLLEGRSGAPGGEAAATAFGRFAVGDPLPVGAGGSVRRPDGETVPASDRSAYYRGTDLAGIYTVMGPGGSDAEAMRFAVNLDPGESRTLPHDPERLEEAGIVLAASESRATEEATAEMTGEAEEDSERHLLDVDKEKRQSLWRWLVLGAVVVVFLEMALSGRLSQPAVEKPVTS